MRELKFRTWDLLAEEMIGWEHWNKENAFYFLNSNGSSVFTMQYTGLTDRNGKEIYEGDIVKITHEYGEYEVYRIEYQAQDDYPAFDTVPNINCDSNGLSHAMAVCEIEIIGNIYEHPQLLKEANNHVHS